MATKKVILKEIVDGVAGDSLYTKTSIDLVEGLEEALDAAGSVSTISVNNGTPIQPVNKNINITVPEDLADLNEDLTHQTVTAAQKTEWSNKSTFSGNYNDLTNKPTIPSAVTESTVSSWGFIKDTDAYSKPSEGIPSTDMTAAVQASLGKADTAIQSVTVGTTTTGAAGTDASVTNTGTATEPILSFTIPQGAQGIQGIQGIQGPQGDPGPKGDSGVTGDVSDLVIKQAIDVEETYEDTDIAGAVTVKTLTNEDLSNEEVIAEALVEFASYFNDGYYLKGVLAPSDEIGEQIGRVIFLAGKGTYENLNDNNTYVIEDGYIGLFIWDGTSWSLKKVSSTYTDSSTTDTTLQYSGEHISLQNTASYIKHMNLSPIAGSSGYEGRQGADCYRDYLFTFQKENATCQIYSLTTKQKIADVVVSGLPTTYHYNAACFGTAKHTNTDTFPLLYISGDYRLFVVRVQESNSSFTMEVVQTITYTTSPGIGTFAVDGSYVWGMTYRIGWQSQDPENDRVVLKKLRLPALSEGDIEITEVLDSFELPWIYCGQGGKVLNGRLYRCYGNTYSINSVQVVDLATHQQVAYISLGAIATSGVEIEDVFFYKGNLGLCYMNMVYMLKFL